MAEEEEEVEDERSYFPGEIKVNRVLYLLVFHLFHCFTIVQLSRKLLYLNLLLGIIWNFSDVSVLMRRRIYKQKVYRSPPYGPGENKNALIIPLYCARAGGRVVESYLRDAE